VLGVGLECKEEEEEEVMVVCRGETLSVAEPLPQGPFLAPTLPLLPPKHTFPAPTAPPPF
jgi:hypothetical protein